MQRALLLALLFAQAASYGEDIKTELETLREETSLLLYNLSRQHLLRQCNATRAPANARRLASRRQAAGGEAGTVVLKPPTIESLAELLEQLAASNGIYDEVLSATRCAKSQRQRHTSEAHREALYSDYNRPSARRAQ